MMRLISLALRDPRDFVAMLAATVLGIVIIIMLFSWGPAA